MARSTDLLARIEGDLAEDGAISDEIRFVTRDADQAAAVHAPGFAVAWSYCSAPGVHPR